MSVKYLLNENILFTPADNTLQAIDGSGSIIHLNGPASRCLQLLLTRFPEAASQKDFFSFVWGEQGSQLPTNALYQNISLLRRALTSSSMSLSGAVLTIPRMGFKFNPSITVKVIDKDDGEDIRNKQNKSVTLNKGGVTNKTNFTQVINSILTMSIVFTWCWIIIGNYSINKKEDYFGEYKYETSMLGCRIFLPLTFIKSKPYNLKANLSKVIPDCSVYRNIYYNERSDRARISLLQCKDNVNKSNDCITRIYWNEQK